MNLLTLIVYEPHWIDGPVVSEVRGVTRETKYLHTIRGTRQGASSFLTKEDVLRITHKDGEVERYRLWHETQFYVIPHDPQGEGPWA